MGKKGQAKNPSNVDKTMMNVVQAIPGQYPSDWIQSDAVVSFVHTLGVVPVAAAALYNDNGFLRPIDHLNYIVSWTADTVYLNLVGLTLDANHKVKFFVSASGVPTSFGIDQNITNLATQRIGVNKYFGIVGDSRADYTDWTTLMSACQDGDTVIFLPGSYSWSVDYNVTKKVMIVIPNGVTATISATKGFSVQHEDVKIQFDGIFVNSAGAYAIYVETTGIRCSIKGSGLFNGFGTSIYEQPDTFIDSALREI